MNRNLRNRLLALPLYALCSCSTTSKTNSINAFPVMIWQDKPVVVDGNNDDWSLPYSYTDSKARIEYSYANDKDNLYLTLKTGDRLTLLKIMDAGMQVWIDPSGRKKKITGISFPLARAEAMSIPHGNRLAAHDSSGMKICSMAHATWPCRVSRAAPAASWRRSKIPAASGRRSVSMAPVS